MESMKAQGRLIQGALSLAQMRDMSDDTCSFILLDASECFYEPFGLLSRTIEAGDLVRV